jgi:hypothetical protein
MLRKICNRVSLPVLIMNSRIASVWLKTGDRDLFLTRLKGPDTKFAPIVFAFDVESPLVGFS